MTDGQDPRLGRWPMAIDVRVAWGEMDAFKHLNNVIYVRYMESARIAYFERTGLPLDGLERGPILVSQTVHYRRAVLYPDTLSVAVTTIKLGNTSFVNGYRMVNGKGELVCEGESTGVWFDYKLGAKVPLDDAFRAAIYGLEAKAKG
ncbi:MAG: acyl-CoA thioesterase [Myxococcota bacterium]|nr:acyl-CoA thioesterase [Myxococcota bacterium]